MEYKIILQNSRYLLCFYLLLSLQVQLGTGTGTEEKDFSLKLLPQRAYSLPATATAAKDLNGTTLFDLPFKVDKEDIFVETLRFMNSIMNLEANPCENFYEYACGNWKNSERVPKESQSTTFLTAILNKMEKFLIEHMKNVTKEEDKMKIGKRFFSACVKDISNVKSGIDSLLVEEQSIYDKVKGINGTKWVLFNFMSPYNVYPLLPFTFHYCRLNRRMEIVIRMPKTIVQKQMLQPEFVKLFEDKKTELTEVIDFEKNLTQSVKPRDKEEYLTLGKFLQSHEKDTINWTEVFDVAFHGKIDLNWVVGNEIADFTAMERVLRRTAPLVLRNYVKWTTLIHFYQLWTERVEEDPNYEKICLRQTEKYFSNNLLPLLIKHLYNEVRKEDLFKMILHLQTEFDKIIDQSTLIDKRSKIRALNRIHSLDYLVGYTEEMILNSTAPYSEENITNNYFKNLQAVEAYNAAKDRQSVGLVEKEKVYLPYTVNAYYVHVINKISIPIGVSQMPLYHIMFPNSLKYAGIGFMIAHEIAHALDVKANDNAENVWYTEESKDVYRERYNCFVDEYNDFIFQGLSMNISATINDNIADNVASQIAYQTYLKNAGHVSGYKIPILNLTDTQVFFLKLAQSWCTGHDSTFKANQMQQAGHTYPDFRVKGILRNMPEFSEAFNCHLGAEMNPFKKCKIW